MKKVSSFIIALIAGVSLSVAQESSITSTDDTETGASSSKVREIGLLTNNLNTFGISYKCGTEKALWRFQTVDLQWRDDDGDNSALGFGVRVGREWRSALSERFELKAGVDLIYNYNQNSSAQQDDSRSTPGVGGVFGVNYICKENLVITAALWPSLRYNMTSTTQYNDTGNVENETNSDELQLDISSRSAWLTVAYRF